MKFNHLYIKDFKNIQEVEINSFNRVNLISGNNGQGKSSVVQVLNFLLTNDLDEKLENYIRWGCDKFEIEAEIEHEGHKYIYEIEVGKSTKKTLTIDDDSKNALSNSEASKKFAEVVDPVLTKYSCIAEQGKTTQLLFQKPTERLKTIKEILKIDSIFKAVENIKEDAKACKADVDKIDSEQVILRNRTYTFADTSTLQKEIEDDKDIQSVLETQEKTKKLFEEQKAKLEKYQKDLDAYTKSKKAKDDLTQNIFECKNEIETHEKSKPEVFVWDSATLLQLQSDLRKKEDALIKYGSEVKSYNDKIKDRDNLKKLIDKADEDISRITIERIPVCKFNDTTVAECNAKIRDKSVELKEVENRLALAVSGKCPTCGQDYVTSVEDIEKQIVSIKEQLKDLNTELDMQYSEIKKHKDKVDAQKEASSLRKSLQDKKSVYEEQLKSLENLTPPEKVEDSDIQSIKDSIIKEKEFEKKFNDANNRIKDIDSLIKGSRDKLSFYEKELIKIEDVSEPEKIEESIVKFDTVYYEDVKKRASVYDQKKAELGRLESLNESVKKEKDSNDKLIIANDSKKESLLKEISILNDTRSVLEKEFSSFLVDKSITSIRNWMNDFFQKTYSKYEVTVEQDKSSVNFFYKGVEDVLTPCSMASGAEADILAVANRVALSKIQNLGIMLADEIDSQMSVDNSIAMYNHLFDQSNIDQFFIITHNESTKEMIESRNDSCVFEIEDGCLK